MWKRKGTRGERSVAAVNPGVYKAVLRVREAYAFDVAGFLMRFYSYMMNIGTVTMLTLAGYSFFIAGLVSSAVALATFLIAPRVSKLIDECGQSHIVPVAAAITLVGLIIMLVCVSVRGPEWVLFAAALLMGFVPSPQALVRARWTYLIRTGRLGKDAPELRTMFSYEGVLDDIGFMFSPALSIALASSITPIAGLLAGGIAFAIGSVILSLSRSTQPEPGWATRQEEGVEGEGGAPDAADASGMLDAADALDTPAAIGAAAPDKRKSIIRTSPMVRILFVLMLFLGGFYGTFDTTTVSLAEDLGEPNIASVILIVASFVSMIMGFVFGMINLRVPQHIQLVGSATLIGCAYGSMFLIDSAVSLFVISTVGALFYAPFLIVANATCERSVPGDRLTEAITWMNAGITCGMAIGPTVAGAVIDQVGTVYSFDFGALLALAIPATALLCFRIIKRNVRTDSYVEVAKRPAK